MSKTLSQHAVAKLNDILNNHSNHVGSELKKSNPQKYSSYISSDCITMAIWVLKYAFEKTQRPDISQRIGGLGHKGTELAKYLINTHNWKAVYYNPDVNHPLDADGEHISSYYNQIKKTCTYSTSKVPVSNSVVNYQPSTTKVTPYLNLTTLKETDYHAFQKVPFGLGMSRGGRHVWVYSSGNVYESHWDKEATDDLYTSTRLRDFEWLSGIIVVPPDSHHLLNITKVICK